MKSILIDEDIHYLLKYVVLKNHSNIKYTIHEAVIDNELEKEINLKIIRQDHNIAMKVGRFADGFISETNNIILFDEEHHFIDKQEQLIYNKNSIQETKDYELNGFKVFRISKQKWKENKKEIIEKLLRSL